MGSLAPSRAKQEICQIDHEHLPGCIPSSQSEISKSVNPQLSPRSRSKFEDEPNKLRERNHSDAHNDGSGSARDGSSDERPPPPFVTQLLGKINAHNFADTRERVARLQRKQKINDSSPAIDSHPTIISALDSTRNINVSQNES
jgi:hypothetical protein